ncbi:carboxylating nicotinate-nucleotide diphosphorylase [Nesterenkonia lutea]|uniref:nicotinate-nucleotide diphosphorylase (carboxylating) n=1 Tax=Nesterenkonia lutea TaxID=272919 RepID=A0ABR9JCF0_9MICC|nr:carboxylating nicotinate-nucleotide diphosphorylase [Nesterenkonia lutea]MBE1523600.1 nicotinate-nucleotide pyrophosphorylase (carboxylating) [Nesterenkonia lutea]
MDAQLSSREIDAVITLALAEDIPFGDLTSLAFVPAQATAQAQLVAREPGVLAGGEIFARTFAALDADVVVRLQTDDGARFRSGDVLARVQGPARAILGAERVALNLIQRLSGVATLTSDHVAAVAGTGVRVTDTRKTTPGLRALERYAVRCGGGHNHRFSLSDAVMAKDNHLALVGDSPQALTAAIRGARERLPHTTHIEVEVDRVDQIDAVLTGGADTIMLDNFSLEDLRRGVDLIGDKALIEASGGVDLETIGAIAATGVDIISVGALTHGARALDLGLDMGLDMELDASGDRGLDVSGDMGADAGGDTSGDAAGLELPRP